MTAADEETRSGIAADDELAAALRDHSDYLRVERGLSSNTLAAYRRDLLRYEAFLRGEGITSLDAVPSRVVRAFVESLPDAGLSARSTARSLSAIRSLHRFAVREELASDNPCAGIASPRIGKSLPKALDQREIESILDSVTGGDSASLRDRAVLETLYATGARISEVVGLDTGDLDFEERSLRVVGKGDKERFVPLGKPAIESIERYLIAGRPAFVESRVADRAQVALFVNARGGRLTRQGLWKIVKSRAARAGVKSGLSPHVFRHSCATHMLEGGADIRAVQEILGHASLSTTQVYTKVTTGHIHDVYLQSHPRARSNTRP